MTPICHTGSIDRAIVLIGSRSCRLAVEDPDQAGHSAPMEVGVMARFHAWIGIVTVLHTLGVVAVAQDTRIPATVLPPGPRSVYRLSLEDAQRIALADNTGLVLGRLGVQEKSIAVDAARRDYFPKLLGSDLYFHFNSNLGRVVGVASGKLGILPSGTPVAVTAVNQDSNLFSITLAQPITKLIAVNAAVQLARADAQIAQTQLDKGTRDLLSGVAQAYYGLYGAQRIEAALGLQIEFATRLAKTNSDPEIRVGIIEAQQGLLQVQAQIAELTEQLNNLLGQPSCTHYELVVPLPPVVPVRDSEEAVHLALRCNPQVQEAMATVEKARAALKVANAEFLPDVTIFGSYFNQTSLAIIPPNFGALGISATYTFFDWGKRRRVRDQRETQIAQASLNVRSTIEKVRLETVQAYAGYQHAQQAFGLAQDMLGARKDAEGRHKDPEGLAIAQAATAKSELELIQAEIAYRVAYARLVGTIGNQ
jgi:outer membrane protein TolC